MNQQMNTDTNTLKKSVVLLDPASLNKEGVSWLAFGRNREAIECFKQALVTMRASLHHQAPNNDTTLPPPACSEHGKYSTVAIPIEEERFYMYSRATEFNTSHEAGVCERDYPLYSALILFNIGLAYHLRSSAQARQCGAEERALGDAAYFYSMSLQILEAIQPYFKKSTIAPVKLAALNNLAVVTYEQGNARKAFWILRDTYQLLSPTLLQNNVNDDSSSGNSSSFDQSDFDGITLNSVMTKWTFSAPCA